MKVTIKKDKDGNEIRRDYEIYQGDTFGFVANPVNAEQGIVSGFVFKLGVVKDDTLIEQVYEQEFFLNDEGKYLLSVPSEETAKWQPSGDIEYKYEIETHFADGNQETAKTGNFKVEPQITEA